MKPLYKLTEKNKETKLSLVIYSVLEEIETKANEWFKEVFIEPKDYISSDILTSNLKQDIRYLLTQAIWLVDLSKSQGYNVECERWVESLYKVFTAKPTGYRYLVTDERYNKQKNKVYTPEQVKENKKRSNEIALKILAELK